MFGRCSNVSRRLGGDLLTSGESEEFSLCILCFDDAVRIERDATPWLEENAEDWKVRAAQDSERQRAFKIHFSPVEIRGEMASIGDLDESIGREIRSQCRRKASTGAAEQTFVEAGQDFLWSVGKLRSGADGAYHDRDQHGRR